MTSTFFHTLEYSARFTKKKEKKKKKIEKKRRKREIYIERGKK